MPPSVYQTYTASYENPRQSEVKCNKIRIFNPVKWFKKIREKHKRQREKYFRERDEREDELRRENIRKTSIVKVINNIDKFPGNLEEYNKFKGVEHTVIDTGLPEKLVIISENRLRVCNLDYSLLESLISKGCKGFIYYKEIIRFEHIRWIGGLSSGSYDRPYIQKCGVPVKETKNEIELKSLA